MAHSVMVKHFLKAEEQQAMLVATHLDLFMCCFKVEAGSDKSCTRVFWQKGESHIGCHWKAHAFRYAAVGVDPLSRTWRGSFPSACTTLSLPTAMPLCQCCRACSSDKLVRTTQRFAISFPGKACATSGSDSAAFQLPMHSDNSEGCSQRSFFRAIA